MRRASIARSVAVLGLVAACGEGKPQVPAVVEAPPLAEGWGRVPLRFEENRGQFDPRVRYLARQGGMTMFLTDDGAVLSLARADEAPVVVTMKVHDALAAPLVAGEPLVTRTNYLLGDDPSRWHTGVRTYAAVAVEGVRPGVDLVYHGSTEGRLEYDLVVAAGASPDVELEVGGADEVRVTEGGALELAVAGGALLQLPPTVYQVIDGSRREIPARYRVAEGGRVGFVLGAYDATRPVVIDPVLSWATYLGGSGAEKAFDVEVDGTGAVYVCGESLSTDFPVTGGASQATSAGARDVFITKIAPDGRSLVYATYLGGSADDFGLDLAVDGTGAVYATGQTSSPNFPTVSALQGALGATDAFVTKLSADGSSVVYSTFLGGGGLDAGSGIVVDAAGRIGVTGWTASSNFPVTADAQDSSHGGGATDVFVAVLAPSGATLTHATYLGGDGIDQGVDLLFDGDFVVVTGMTSSSDFPATAGAPQTTHGVALDGFVAKLSATSNATSWATYLGGGGQDVAQGLAIDASGAVVVVGQTGSVNFPVANAFQPTNAGGDDAFIAKLAPTGDSLVYSTYLGASAADAFVDVALDAAGNAYAAGMTQSPAFPLVGAFRTTAVGGEAIVARIDPTGTPRFSSFLGGSGDDAAYSIAVGRSGIYLVGITSSTDLATAGVAQAAVGGGGDAFVAKLGMAVSPATLTVPPRGSATFTSAGGLGATTWSLTAASGGTIDPATGAYTSGPTADVEDVVHAEDEAGLTATAVVTVGPGVTVTPSLPAVPPRGALTFSASGGSDDGFAWSLTANPSGGTIDPATGVYVAGDAAAVSDTVRVTDSLGNTASVNVSVGDGLAINPAAPTVAPRGATTFTAMGGSGAGYAWSLSTAASGGTIDPTTGVYTAGATGGVSDVVALVDSLGNGASVTVSVGPGISLTPVSSQVMSGDTITFAAGGGSGAGYAWALATSASGGTIDSASGAYTAGPSAGTDVVEVVDSLGNSAAATVDVAGGPGGDADGCDCQAGGRAARPLCGPFLLLGLVLLVGRRRRRRA